MREILLLLLLIVIIELFKTRNAYKPSKFIYGMISNTFINEGFSWKKVDSHTYKRITGKTIRDGNYASNVINQHSSTWCGCCYMVATLQMIQDRIHVFLGKQDYKTRMVPWVLFDLQSMLDHYQLFKGPFTVGWNACKGGLPLNLLNCMEEEKCPFVFQTLDSIWMGHPQRLTSINNTNMKIKIEDSKRIIPTSRVQDCILNDGPVVLSISAKILKEIDENGFSNPLEEYRPDHAVSVIGWKFYNGKKYWIIRNSWGEKQVPSAIPKDLSCVSVYENTCKVEMQSWVGDVNNPGYVYVPSDYPPLNNDLDSPWFETKVFVKT